MLQEIPMMFTSEGVPLAGTLIRNSASLSERQRCVVVTGSWLNVKEQMAIGYARALAKRGLAAFTFDFTGWGASGGVLRHWEIPTQKARDIAAAVDFVSSLSFAGPKVGHLAVCASAQYALRAAANHSPVASLVTVAGWFHDAVSVAPFYGGEAGVSMRLERAYDALAQYQRNADLRMVPAYAPGDDRAGMFFDMDYYGNTSRGAVKEWSNQMAETSWLNWFTFDGLAAAESVSTPMLSVHSDGCVFPDNVKTVHSRLTGKKRIDWFDSGTQTDFYDLPEYVNTAADRAAEWFEETL